MLADHFSLPFLFIQIWLWLRLWQIWLERQLFWKFAQIQLMKRSRVVKLSHSHSLKKATFIVECVSKLACSVWKIIGTTLAIPKKGSSTLLCVRSTLIDQVFQVQFKRRVAKSRSNGGSHLSAWWWWSRRRWRRRSATATTRSLPKSLLGPFCLLAALSNPSAPTPWGK